MHAYGKAQNTSVFVSSPATCALKPLLSSSSIAHKNKFTFKARTLERLLKMYYIFNSIQIHHTYCLLNLSTKPLSAY